MSEIKYTPEARQQRNQALGEAHSLTGVCKVYNDRGELLRIEKSS